MKHQQNCFMQCKRKLIVVLVGLTMQLVACKAVVALENDEDSNDTEPDISDLVYRSPEERREAGLGREIAEGLTVSALLELEKEAVRYRPRHGDDVNESEHPTQTLQVGFMYEKNDWLEAEFIFEAENEKVLRSRLDEAIISLEFGDLGIGFGRFDVPFGEYYSYFIVGPLLEFSETRANTVTIDYTFFETIEVTAFGFESKVDKQGHSQAVDWGVGFEFATPLEDMRFGIGYLSDLAESDEQLLAEEANHYQNKVGAWNAYFFLGMDITELTLEVVKASKAFAELDREINKPMAANIEYSYFASDSLLFSFRYEISKELAEAPEKQFGITAVWTPVKHVVIGVEYLVGHFKPGFAETDEEISIKEQQQIAGRIGFEF